MPVFSRVTIEFLVDFEAGYSLSLKRRENGVNTLNTWTWVASRSSGFEVTEGTPTATSGERTAINFEAAYDLDFPTGFVTTQTTNEIQIDSETEGEDFISIRASDGSNTLVKGVAYNVTFENYVVPFDVSTVDKMLARSPHYVTTPFYLDTTTDATIKLKVYTGHFTNDEPASATQTITKIRPTVDYEEFNTNISDTVRNYLETAPDISTLSTTSLVDSGVNEVQWVRYTASYTDPSEELTEVTGFLAASDGYSEFLDGINFGFSGVLTSCERRKASEEGVIMLPFVNDGTYTQVVQTSTPTNEVSQTLPFTTSEESTDYVQYIITDVTDITSDSGIVYTFTLAAGGTEVYHYDIERKCRYDQFNIIFKNKYGFYDTVNMFAKSTETLMTESDIFVNNYVSNGSYSTNKHQNQKLNLTAKKSIVLNSGYIKEVENTLYEELLTSEYVWFYMEGTLTPVNVKTSNWTYKTRVNDSLIEYSIEFDYAYQLINNI